MMCFDIILGIEAETIFFMTNDCQLNSDNDQDFFVVTLYIYCKNSRYLL